jgi:hypothetical protein
MPYAGPKKVGEYKKRTTLKEGLKTLKKAVKGGINPFGLKKISGKK